MINSLVLFIFYFVGMASIYANFVEISIISIILFYIYSIKNLSPNILFIARQTIIFIVIITIHINISYGYLVSVHLQDYQTKDYGLIATYIGFTGLFFSHFGFLTAQKIHITIRSAPRVKNSSALLTTVLLALVITGYAISQTKEIAFISAYGTYEGEKSTLGNLNVIIATLGMLTIKLFKDITNNKDFYKKIIIFAFIYVSVWCMFIRGMRMDVIALIFSVYIYSKIINQKTEEKIPYKTITITGVLLLIFQVWGVLRSIDIDFSDIVQVTLTALQTRKDFILFYQGTFNDIAATFTGIIGMIDTKIINHSLGETYFDYLLRTPPEFMYPSRPESPAWIFNAYGFTSGGGFYEMAEGYYNFGAIGSLLQTFLISFIIGLSYKIAIKNHENLYSHVPIISVMAAFVRGSIYESFNFYKSFLTVSIIVFLMLVFIKIFFNSNTRNV